MLFKRTLLPLFLFFCVPGAAFAQVRISDIQRNSGNFYEWGFFTGSNFQQLSATPFIRSLSNGNATGFYIRKRKKMLGLQTSLSVSTARYETEFPLAHRYITSHRLDTDTTSKGIFNAFYINLPVIAEIHPVKWFGLQMGVAYSYNVYNHDANGAYANVGDEQKLFKKSNILGIAGMEFELSPKLKIQATGSVGFLDVNNGNFQGLNDKWYVNNATVTMMWRFKKWYPALKRIKKK